MTTEPADGAEALRTALRLGLTTAMKSRDRDALAALRTAIAAIDNAEAVPAPDAAPAATSAHIAGARSGLGAAEAARRELSASELQDILRGQISEHTSEADRYDALGQADSAARLRRQADSLAPYLP
ncbi:MAG TPA: hypothetical protein VN714_21585 [Trebonia sp.]|nr:hypothetical protein [Trebonia sp.]